MRWPWFLKPKIVELAHVVGDDERRDAVLEALLKENQAPDATVAVLERMYLLESSVQVEQILEGLLRALPPVQQLRHLAAHVLGMACLHFADDIVKALVVADGKPLLAAVGRTALEDFMKTLYFLAVSPIVQ